MSLTICTWLWGDRYGPDDVRKLAAGIRRHLKRDHRFILIADDENVRRMRSSGRVPWQTYRIGKEDAPLLREKGCFARLRMFSPVWQERKSVDDRLVCIDLDTVITGPLDVLFDRPEPFVILHGGNVANPCLFGGALMMLRAGAHPEVWSDFSLDTAARIPFYSFPDDQGWIWNRVPNAAGWKCGPESGVYVFRKSEWPGSDALPRGARLVTFNGWRSPVGFKHLEWVKNNWRT